MIFPVFSGLKADWGELSDSAVNAQAQLQQPYGLNSNVSKTALNQVQTTNLTPEKKKRKKVV